MGQKQSAQEAERSIQSDLCLPVYSTLNVHENGIAQFLSVISWKWLHETVEKNCAQIDIHLETLYSNEVERMQVIEGKHFERKGHLKVIVNVIKKDIEF